VRHKLLIDLVSTSIDIRELQPTAQKDDGRAHVTCFLTKEEKNEAPHTNAEMDAVATPRHSFVLLLNCHSRCQTPTISVIALQCNCQKGKFSLADEFEDLIFFHGTHPRKISPLNAEPFAHTGCSTLPPFSSPSWLAPMDFPCPRPLFAPAASE
jgi:hypothetical protein